ncbi:NEAT domain-containing protein [Gracilibacillus suaedae]|uniref:NEAT domain-containing protein n=1 Tax=Gracilibacillus suaedae TaxID=2820273 RepID=UPI001ABED878|nr:NEAT domain-containing protein [Gracilibacillus suaedae]
MRRRWQKTLAIFSIWLVLLATVLPTGSISAEQAELANGEYTIDFTFLKDGTDSTSVMDEYSEKPATLHVNDGQLEVDLTLTNSDWIQLFQTEQAGEYVDAEVIEEDTEANKRTVRFPVKNLTDKVEAYTHVIVTGIPGFEYDNYYEVQIQFDPDSIQAINVEEPAEETEEDTSETPTEEEAPEESSEEDGGESSDEIVDKEEGETEEETSNGEENQEEVPELELEDGKYSIDFRVLDPDKDEELNIGNLPSPAVLEVKDGNTSVLLDIYDPQGQITDIRIDLDGTLTSSEIISDDSKQARTPEFPISSLSEPINAEIDYYVEQIDYTNVKPVRLDFDVETIAATDDEEEESDIKIEDGKYTIDFTALHASKDEESRMADYFASPAVLEVSDGEAFVLLDIQDERGQLTEIRLDDNGTHTNGEIVSGEAPGNRTVKYPISYLSEPINAEVDMYVAEMDYENTQPFRLLFDETSISALDDREVDLAQDGEYTIDFEFLKNGTDTTSVMDVYAEKPATLHVNDGQLEVDLTLTSSDWIKLFQTKQDGQYVDAEVIDEDTEADKRTVRFPVENVTDKVEVYTHVVVPDMNYDHTYEVQIQFDPDSVAVVKLEDPGDDTDDETGEYPTKPDQPEKIGDRLIIKDVSNFAYDEANKAYQINGNDANHFEISAAIFNSLADDSKLSFAKDNEVKATFPVNQLKEKLGDSESIHFTIEKVDSPSNAKSGFYDFHVAVDDETVSEFSEPVTLTFTVDQEDVNNWSDLKVVYINDDGEVEEEINPTERNQESGEVVAEVSHFSQYGVLETEEKGQQSENGLEDGEYTIDFTFLKNGTEETSVMDGYTEKPATLHVNDGQLEVDLTFTNSDWIKLFQTRQNSEYVDAEVIAEDTAADKRTVRFAIENLTDKVDAYTHVIVTGVPGLEYDNYYEVQLQFDPDSLNEVSDTHPTPADPVPSDPEDPSDPEPTNPEGDNNLTYNGEDEEANTGSNTSDHQNVQNTKTADSFNIMMVSLLVSLLIGSAYLLYRKYRLGSL